MLPWGPARELKGKEKLLPLPLLLVVFIYFLFRSKFSAPRGRRELGEGCEALEAFASRDVSGILYLADDSPPSTLVTASRLRSGRRGAGDLGGVRSDRILGERVGGGRAWETRMRGRGLRAQSRKHRESLTQQRSSGAAGDTGLHRPKHPVTGRERRGQDSWTDTSPASGHLLLCRPFMRLGLLDGLPVAVTV